MYIYFEIPHQLQAMSSWRSGVLRHRSKWGRSGFKSRVGKIILLFLTKDTSNICKLTTAVSIAYHYVLFHEKLLLRMECSFVR